MSPINEGVGRRKPQLDIKIENLHVDPLNPRLPKNYQGQKEEDILDAMYKFFNLQELALSMFENGYFDAEPLVVIPEKLPKEFEGKEADNLKNNQEYLDFIGSEKTHFIVVEGNRRLSTVKLLLNKSKKTFPVIEDEATENDLRLLPSIIYPRRKDVLAYLGARHIIGTKKWDAYAKARYIASLKEEHGFSMDDIQRTVGDTAKSARKIYAAYKFISLIEQEFEDIDTSEAKEYFSFLILSSGQGAIKDYIGLPKNWDEINFDGDVIPKEKVDKLKNLFLWLFGDGKQRRKVIEESRDITNKLTPILRREESTKYLEETSDLIGAFDRSDGEKNLVLNYVTKANSSLEKSLQMLHRHKEELDIRDGLKKLKDTLSTALKIVGDD